MLNLDTFLLSEPPKTLNYSNGREVMVKNHWSPCSGMLSVTSIFDKSIPQAADVSLERTPSNDSTIEKNVVNNNQKRRVMPHSLNSVVLCDIFRPLREAFFSEEEEDMISIRRANPVCCSMVDTLSDDEDEGEHKSMGLEVPNYSLIRQDAFITHPPRYFEGSTERQGRQLLDNKPGEASRSS